MIWTLDKLRALTVAQRHEVWKKAKAKGLKELQEMIEGCGAPYTETACLHANDPEYLEMSQIVFGSESRQAAATATNAGLPAMAAVDLILQERMGNRYGFRSMDTAVAGSLVKDMMLALGYKKTGKKGKLPDNCIAKTAEIYDPSK